MQKRLYRSDRRKDYEKKTGSTSCGGGPGVHTCGVRRRHADPGFTARRARFTGGAARTDRGPDNDRRRQARRRAHDEPPVGITPLNPTKYIAMQGDKIIEGLFFDSLVNINEKMEVEPFLAESWTVSEDGLTIDMKLKEGVKYFDGTEMTAETVKYCWDWYLDPDTAANFYPLISDVQSVDAVDQYNLRFNFSQPNAGFIELMSYQAGYVLSPASIDKYKQTGDETVFAREGGTGAFKLVENVDGVSITAEKNPDYHVMGEDGQPLPYLDGVVVKIIGDEAVAASNLISGDLDMIDVVSQPAVVSQISNAQGCQIKINAPREVFHLYMNMEQEPFDDPLVRQAMCYAVNRDELNQVVSMGQAIQTPWLTLPDQWYYKDGEIIGYDPAKAKELLAQAGYPDGVEVELYYGTYGVMQAECELIQAQAKEAGFNIKLVGMDGASVKTLWALQNTDAPAGMRLQNNIIPKSDPYTQMEYIFGENAIQNCSRWIDAEYQELLKKVKVTFDRDEAKTMLDRMQDIGLEQMPTVVLQAGPRRSALADHTMGVYFDCDASMNFRAAWLNK